MSGAAGEVLSLDKKQKEMADSLLQVASDRLKSVSGDVSAFNLLSALQIEHFETRTHSKIIYYLLNDRGGQDAPHNFLLLFLRVLGIPEKFLSETWRVDREWAAGTNRMDFVIESKSCCVIIEMKIDARDGDRQLIRYETVGQRKGKDYVLYYLTLDGHMPEERSAGGIEADRLRCISFKNEMILWLRECMKCVDKNGYKYSFLKQYLGAVRQITGNNDEVMSVKDLLNSSDRVKAARLVADSFYEKMEDIKAQFLQKLDGIIKRKTRLETYLYPNELDIYLKEFTHRKHAYRVVLFVDCSAYLNAGLAFEVTDDDIGTLRLDEAERAFPSIYREWMGKLDALEGVPRFKRWAYSRYFDLENSRGAKLNFKDYTAQIELIDEMNQQCKYIGDNIINRMIKPLLNA